MSPSREELLALALGVLPEPPCGLGVLSEAGGSWQLEILAHDQGLLHAYAPAARAASGLHLLARMFDQGRGRYEIEFEVIDTFFHTGELTLVHLAVSAVRHRKARRASPRVSVAVQFEAEVKYCQAMPGGTLFEARLVDVSATGLAFVTQKDMSAGDLVRLVFPLAGQRMDIEARVVRLDPAPYGRHRCGCEITEISDQDRKAIGQLAVEAEQAGSERERRRPEVVAALAEARESRAMAARLAERQAS